MASPNDQLGGPGASSPADPLKSQVPQGGPGTWDDNPSTANNRSSKKRALRACVSCRDRKVRCDVVNGGVPCTNCRLDDVDCVLKASNRGKHNHARNRARSSLPSNATAPRGSSPPTAISTTTIAVGSGPSHGSVATRLLQERHGSRPLSRGDEGARYGDDEDESNNLHDQQESERIRTPPDAQFQPSRTVHEVRHDEQPQPRSSQEPVRRVTPAAQPVDPPTSDHLVALAYQGESDPLGESSGSVKFHDKERGKYHGKIMRSLIWDAAL